MEKTKPTSDHIEAKASGLCLPRRSTRAALDSSNLEESAPRVCSFLSCDGDVGKEVSF